MFDPFSMAGILGGLGSAGKGIWDLFGNNNRNNPATAARDRLNQIPGQVKPYYDPYINAGKDSLNTLQGQYGDLVNNPGQKFADLGAGYKQSPGYQATLREALSGANNAAAMGGGGGLGTFGHEQLAATAAGDVANKDYEDYINHVLGLYGTGLSGNQDIEKQGADASMNYGDILGQIGGQDANYAGAGKDWQNQQNNNALSGIFGGLGQAGGSYFLGPEIQKYFDNYIKGGY